jgi:hypothetical protein
MEFDINAKFGEMLKVTMLVLKLQQQNGNEVR